MAGAAVAPRRRTHGVTAREGKARDELLEPVAATGRTAYLFAPAHQEFKLTFAFTAEIFKYRHNRSFAQERPLGEFIIPYFP